MATKKTLNLINKYINDPITARMVLDDEEYELYLFARITAFNHI